jgi:bifunctional non-homologous end joining protein LigD
MSLARYNEKRDFEKTAEPKGKPGKSKEELIFVVQKHAASHLHYDFRLEMDGVLKSWAVPKGPSMDPQIRRLAMMVEDHPYSYKDFEGNIPEGNYGAGNVIVWDNGTYAPSDEFKGTAENKLHADLRKGSLSFILKGKKLKGEFSLVKLKSDKENTWLLIKKNDKYATKEDILKKNKSVISRSTLEALEKKTEKELPHPEKKKPLEKTDRKNSSTANAEFIKPMLAGITEMPFDDNSWVFESKYDGYRAIAVINPDNADLFSRNQISFNANFKPIAEELRKIKHTAVLDGEIVVENKSGRSDFQLLQNYIKTGKGILKYYVFDILSLDGNDTSGLSVLERKELLKLLLKKQQLTNISYSGHTVGKGIRLFELAAKNGNEGIIAKKADSKYTAGLRSSNWLKIKVSQQEEAIVIGITEPKKTRRFFGAILMAQYNGKILKYIGKCGTGFKEDTLQELYKKFQPYFIDQSPVEEKIPLRDTIQWIKPKFVCQVKFTEKTQDNLLRHPVFLGLRIDKAAGEVMFTSNTKDMKKENPGQAADRENEYNYKAGKATLHLTNQNKVYFPDDGLTKGDIVAYYNEVSKLILPYLKNRPQSMNRFPNGINAPGFYQKDVDVDKIPSWLKTASIHSESNDADIDYLICNDKATLLYMANLGCIEINPWNSTIRNIESPDWIVIDIDPAKEKQFEEVVKTALTVKEVMDELETDCYCKTSGATGLHVYIPLGGKYSYDTVKILAELIAQEVHERLPETTTLERSIKKREQKIYIDYLQNRKGQTLAAPYSVRPKPGATVSTPLEWKEVNPSLSPSQFTIKNTMERLDKKGDLWKPVLSKQANIKKILKKLEDKKRT